MTASTDARDLYKSIVLRNNLPGAYRKDRASELAKVLAAVGESDNAIGGLFGKANFYGETASPWNGQDRSAIDQARDSMFINTAVGKYLTAIGGNYGVPRPPQSPFDDTLYAALIPVLAWLPKTPMLVAYLLAEAIFGTQASLGVNAWQFYEVNPNEIIFECPISLITGSNTNASYLHGYSAKTTVAAGPTNTITWVSVDDVTKSASSLVGVSLYIFYSGVWNTYTINSASYNASTQTNTIVLNASTVPTGSDMQFFIDIAGTVSFTGDFMLNDASLAAGTPNPTSDVLVYLFGQAKLDIFSYYMNDFVRAAGVTLRTEVL